MPRRSRVLDLAPRALAEVVEVGRGAQELIADAAELGLRLGHLLLGRLGRRHLGRLLGRRGGGDLGRRHIGGLGVDRRGVDHGAGRVRPSEGGGVDGLGLSLSVSLMAGTGVGCGTGPGSGVGRTGLCPDSGPEYHRWAEGGPSTRADVAYGATARSRGVGHVSGRSAGRQWSKGRRVRPGGVDRDA